MSLSAQEEKSNSPHYLAALAVISEADAVRMDRLWQQQSPNLTFPDFVVRMGVAAELNVYQAVARHFDLPLVSREAYQPVESIGGKVSANFLKAHRAVPCGDDGQAILLAICDPENEFVAKSISLACGRPVNTVIGLPSDIETAIEELFGDGRTQIERIADVPEDDVESLDGLEAEKLKDMASEAPVVKLVNLIFNRAQTIGASDIHLEPFEGEFKLRYRVDGVLAMAEAPPSSLAPAVISRLKLMARLNIAERRLPQDGRIRIQHSGQEFDVRVSTVPTIHGESVVMRMLNRGDIELTLESLGFVKSAADVIRSALSRPHGMILVTGPTGSGKTTTLYAALRILNSPEKKVVTIEDPVEYQLSGVNQIQVQPSIDLTFASALRAIVRQDPDVIMVGELRDIETASICIQSALTGHLVLSTVHTNDAAGAVTRLLDMGVESYLLPSTLNLIVAQRLVRKLCERCKNSSDIDRGLRDFLENQHIDIAKSANVQAPMGCDACQHTGYSGRIAIAELLPVDDDIRRLVASGAETTEVQAQAVKNGMVTMMVDGLYKVLSGQTTLDEIMRVTREN